MSETTINAAEILHDATAVGASDIFIVAGLPLSYRVNGVLFHKGERLMPDSTEAFIRQIYDLTRSHTIDTFLKNGDDDFSFSIPGLSRFRVSTYKQRGSLAAVIRVITFELPNPTQLGIPNAVMALSEYTKGPLPSLTPSARSLHWRERTTDTPEYVQWVGRSDS